MFRKYIHTTTIVAATMHYRRAIKELGYPKVRVVVPDMTTTHHGGKVGSIEPANSNKSSGVSVNIRSEYPARRRLVFVNWIKGWANKYMIRSAAPQLSKLVHIGLNLN